MNACVFLGPTLDTRTARTLAPVTLRPPAAVGDVYRAVQDGFATVLLVDGYFHSVPSVQHKEIIFALSEGVTMYGCSSMGALRAAELDDYGMVGVGAIYRAYRDGSYTDDDEVAVAHADSDHGYRTLSVPMVTIRCALARASSERLISGPSAAVLADLAKGLYYADRHWAPVVRLGREVGLPEAELSALLGFVRAAQPDPKRDDAVKALQLLAHGGEPPRRSAVQFEPTYSWSVLVRNETREGSQSDD
jgi:hypothetical protein